jgi:hypothetical protein
MDLGVFKDRQITMICFAEYSCYVHLGEKDHLRIESQAKFVKEDSTYELFPRVDSRALECLLGKEIVRVKEDERAVMLEIEGGGLWIRLDDGYESLMIVIGGKTLVR